jgi:uncharacterized metal-binding protein YceD (DUF177 family)
LKVENQYIIHFKGLKEGVHDFNFVIDKPFFEFHEQLEVSDGHVEATIELNKKTTFMELVVELTGEMQVPCDRCLEQFILPVSYNGLLMVRFSETEKEQDEEVIFIQPDEYELDLRHYLYECLSLSVPIRKVHPDLANGEPGCDPEMLRKLDEYLLK